MWESSITLLGAFEIGKHFEKKDRLINSNFYMIYLSFCINVYNKNGKLFDLIYKI